MADEDHDDEAITRAEQLLERNPSPGTEEEAKALTTGFGPDNCYGLTWMLLHRIVPPEPEPPATPIPTTRSSRS